MRYKYQISENVNGEEWNNNLQKFPAATFLQTYEYISEHPGSEIPVFVSVLDENNQIVGQLGLKIIKTAETYSGKILLKFLSIFSALTKRAIWIYGPLIASSDLHDRTAILEQILMALDEIGEKFDLVHLEGHTPSLDNEVDSDYKNIFNKFNYSSIDEITFVVDLNKTTDELWKDLPRKSRGDVSRAKRRNIVVKELETFEEINQYFMLNVEWAKSKGLVLADINYEINKLWKNHNLGIEKVLLAYQDCKLISGIRIGCFNNVAYTNYAVNSYSVKSNLGGSLLNWFALEWAKNRNMKFYDFSGGSLADTISENNNTENKKNNDHIRELEFTPDEEIHTLLFYKTKWGGSPKKYYNFKKVRKIFFYRIYSLSFNLLVIYHKLIKH